MNKICALPGCGKLVGVTPWVIAGWPEYPYCSRACCDVAFQAGKKGRGNMQVPAPDFGGILTRTKCDVCGGSVLINWKSRDGKDCCSRECQKKAEEDSMPNDNETNDTTTTDPKPITAGAAAPAKKSGKKAAAKAAPPAKAKKPAKKAAAPGKFADEDVIHIISKDHGYRDGGARHQFFALVRDGMTVAKYRKAFHEKKKSIAGHQAAGHELLVYANAGLVKIGK